MKQKDIDRALIKAGWTIEHGGSHDLATNPKHPDVKISIPRHREIKEMTAKGILEDAGVK